MRDWRLEALIVKRNYCLSFQCVDYLYEVRAIIFPAYYGVQPLWAIED